MRIVFVISSLGSGGAEKVLSGLANRFVTKNNEVSIVTFSQKGAVPFYPLDPHISLIQLDQLREDTFCLTRLKNIAKRIFCLRKMLKALVPDVVISFIEVTNLTVLIAGIGLKAPVVVSERTSIKDHQIPTLYKKLRMILYRKAAKVLTQTESNKQLLSNLKNVQVIPNAVTAPKHQKKRMCSKATNIISTGRLCRSKDFETLIKAFAGLAPQYPQLKLAIYGDGDNRANLESLIASFGLEDKVFLPGVTSDVYGVLQKADLFVFPSRYEGFPNALCEAMAVGLPVIASNCPGNIDVVRDKIDGRLFPIGNVNTLTDLMIELIEDCEQRQLLSDNAQQIVTRFNPDEIFTMWDRVVNEAANLRN
ncbi:MAG: glycosyltransferase family 4 protein [Holosporales bacterium]|jgi:glycosyltransferase involved in cell wall biosynthesis|nr:glycosyltransferase family 4 protein [Holosporales bacterium]